MDELLTVPEVQAIPEAKKISRNKMWLVNLSNTSETIYKIGKKLSDSFMKDEPASNRSAKDVGYIQLFYFTYLTGSRIGELLRPEYYPKVQKIGKKTRNYIEITKMNEKHFGEYIITGTNSKGRNIYKGVGPQSTMIQYLPLDEEYDKKMWDFVLNAGLDFSIPFLKRFQGYTESNRTAVSHLFSNNFRADITDGKTIRKNAGLNPHFLRHTRVFNLLINKQYTREMVGQLLGWNARDVERMISTYTYISKQLVGTNLLNYMDDFQNKTNAEKFDLGNELTSTKDI